ncbi:MAG: type II secretion system F family protein [Lachnospiraceae bacterium]|nr:type II secretion system F family protein [Lachnospiraceae bacterium]
MPTYKYVAVNLQKQKFKGKFIAEDEKDLAVQLARQNLYLVSSSEYKGGTPSAFFTLGTGKVSLTELTTFCRQFAIMITSGIQVMDCLEVLKMQSFSSYFKAILYVIAEDVKGGDMLSTALDKHKKVFPDFFVSMVHVGEASGRLESVFLSLANYYESDAAIRRKARGALAYPLMLAGMTVAITILMLAFVVPTFKDVLADLEVKPEGYTAVIYGISDFLVAYWQWILVGVILLVGSVFLFLQTKTGKRAFDVFKIKCPMIKKVTVELITARFARAFSILLSSGMDLVSALDSTALILGNSYMEARFKDASEEVRHGITLTNAFTKYGLFPDMMTQMLSVAEKTNSLDDVLGRSCRFFDEQVEATLNSLTSKIQPIMLVIMGLVIGSLFLAVYAPMLSIMNQLA